MNNCCFAGTHGASDDIWAYSGGSECGLMCFVDPEKYSFEEFEDCLHGTHANNATEADGGGVGMVSFCSEEYVALSKGEKPKKKVNGAVRLNMGLLKAWSVLAGIVGIGVVVGAL